MLTCHSDKVCAQAIERPELQELVWKYQLPGGYRDVAQHAQHDGLAPHQARALLLPKHLLLKALEPARVALSPIKDQNLLQSDSRDDDECSTVFKLSKRRRDVAQHTQQDGFVPHQTRHILGPEQP